MSETLAEQATRVLNEEAVAGLAMDGVTVEVLGCEQGVLRLRLTGQVGSCPASVRAVLIGLEEVVRRRVAGVEHVIIF